MKRNITPEELADLQKTARMATKIWKGICYSACAIAVVCTFFNGYCAIEAFVAYGLGKMMTFEVNTEDNKPF